jgi:uncharacterized protein
MQALYWKADKPTHGAMAFWEDTLRYLYLPRLKSRGVLEQAIVKGAGSRDFFGTAYGQHEGKFDGFKLGDGNVQLDDTLLLIEPIAAKSYLESISTASGPEPESIDPRRPLSAPNPLPIPPVSLPEPASVRSRAFHGNVVINASTAKMRMVELAEEIIAVLAADPNAEVKVSVEIQVNFPSGVSDQTKRAVTENALALSFKNADWE